MTKKIPADTQDRCWQRAHQAGKNPVRLLHRGGIEGRDSDSIWLFGKPSFLYGVDACATGVLRLIATPLWTTRTSAEKGRLAAGVPGAIAGGTVGLLYGIPKGVVGAGVSLGTGAGSFVMAGVAQMVGAVVGTADGCVRGATRVDQIFNEPPKSQDEK